MNNNMRMHDQSEVKTCLSNSILIVDIICVCMIQPIYNPNLGWGMPFTPGHPGGKV